MSKQPATFTTLSKKLNIAEFDLGKAAIALEGVNEVNLHLETRLSEEILKNKTLESEIEAYKKELMIAYKAVTEMKKKLKKEGISPVNVPMAINGKRE